MEADGQVVGRSSEGDGSSGVEVRDSSSGSSPRATRVTEDGIAQVGEVGVVELEVPAAGGVERTDLVAVALGEVVEELGRGRGTTRCRCPRGRRGSGPSWATGSKPSASCRCARPRTGSRRPGSSGNAAACPSPRSSAVSCARSPASSSSTRSVQTRSPHRAAAENRDGTTPRRNSPSVMLWIPVASSFGIISAIAVSSMPRSSASSISPAPGGRGRRGSRAGAAGSRRDRLGTVVRPSTWASFRDRNGRGGSEIGQSAGSRMKS